MKFIIFLLWSLLVAAAAFASQLPPSAFPIFLKVGFSSILDFDETPIRVVLGDGQSFQVEKVERSLVVRTLAPYAASNMFVYFKSEEPRLFVLTASEDANPTYYKKFEKDVPPKPIQKPGTSISRASVKTEPKIGYTVRVLHADFDSKKDYLTLECELSSQSKERLKPVWNLVRITYKSKALIPIKLWAERQEIQKDSHVKFRLIFAKPNLPRDLTGVGMVIPLLGQATAISVSIHGVINGGQTK